jgi:hypothetical protein
MVSFRVGAADAEYLETEFAPQYVPNDIVNLPKYNILLKLMINGVSSDPFSATTLPVDDSWIIGNADKVLRVSRERYGNKIEEVEEKISRWMGSEFHEQQAVVMGQGGRVKEESDYAQVSAAPQAMQADEQAVPAKPGVGTIVMPIREPKTEPAGDPYQFQKQPAHQPALPGAQQKLEHSPILLLPDPPAPLPRPAAHGILSPSSEKSSLQLLQFYYHNAHAILARPCQHCQ